MRILRATTVLLLVVFTVLLASPARAAKLVCTEVLAKAATTVIEDGIEVGELAGLVNGALYLRYVDKEAVDPATSKANLVITTKLGNLYLWVAGSSLGAADGSIGRNLTTLAAYGSGVYARARINLVLSGTFWPEKEGIYAVVGTICSPTPPPPKR